MKYIKQFENINRKYKKGNYVLLSDSYRWLLPYGKILEVSYGGRGLTIYRVEILSPNTKYWTHSEETYETLISGHDIINKLTKKEIKDIEIKIQALKYNL